MHNLRPIYNSFRHFEAIIGSKHTVTRSVLNALKAGIKNRFIEYVGKARSNQLLTISNSTYINSDKNALISCYAITKPLEILKQAIYNKQKPHIRHKCPYCTINAPDTFDHYLPKENYSEFSAFSYNLIPCCSFCNSKKGTIWKTVAGRKYINFYFDKIPSIVYIKCSIVYEDDIPITDFQLIKPPSISNEEFRLIESHYKSLNLFERFSDQSNDFITNTKVTLSANIFNSKDDLRDTIIAIASEIMKQYGYNYWQAAILLGLSNSDEFLDSFEINS
ncbi:hypothetical protein GCM10028805_65180 [Spirosoma harenae]